MFWTNCGFFTCEFVMRGVMDTRWGVKVLIILMRKMLKFGFIVQFGLLLEMKSMDDEDGCRHFGPNI